jgi:hypothetical protein
MSVGIAAAIPDAMLLPTNEWFAQEVPGGFLTVLVDRCLLGIQCCLSTGLVANDIHLTKRCNALLSRSDVTRGLPDLGNSFTLLVCVCFLTSRLTTEWWYYLSSNSFEGHPCCMHADYLPSLCFDILLCTMLTVNEYLVFKTLDLNTQIRSVNILNKGNNKITELRTILQREF